MKIKVICIGKTGKPFLEKGEKEYLNRLSHYAKVEKIEIPDLKDTKKLTIDQIKSAESKLLLSKIDKASPIILLDENGDQYSSVKLSNFLQKKMNQGGKSINFIIGGAYGFSEELYQLANAKISLSKMTFSHQMVRILFLEQLYRSFTIIRNQPYHNN